MVRRLTRKSKLNNNLTADIISCAITQIGSLLEGFDPVIERNHLFTWTLETLLFLVKFYMSCYFSQCHFVSYNMISHCYPILSFSLWNLRELSEPSESRFHFYSYISWHWTHLKLFIFALDLQLSYTSVLSNLHQNDSVIQAHKS